MRSEISFVDRSLVLVRSSSMRRGGRGQLPICEPPAILPCISDPTMDDAEREDILNDALELFGGEKVDESGVVMYGSLRLSVAQKVVSGVLLVLMSSHKHAISLTSLSSSKTKCVLNFQNIDMSAVSTNNPTLEHRQILFSQINYSLQHSF